MESSKQYTFAQVVSDGCKVIGLLAMIGGSTGICGSLFGGDGTRELGRVMLFMVSAAGLVLGLMLVAFGQIVDAQIDTAKNTAKIVELLRSQGEKQPIKQEPPEA